VATLPPDESPARSGWLVALIALAGGLAAPMAMPETSRVTSPQIVGTQDADLSRAPAVELWGSPLAGLAQAKADPEMAAFYAARGERALWIDDGRVRPQARQLISYLRASDKDGLHPADYRPDALEAQLQAAAAGRPADLVQLELSLSTALSAWGSDLHRPKPAAALLYSDAQLRPPGMSRRAVLETFAQAASPQDGLAAVARMNPLYESLRAALAAEPPGGPRAAVIKANMERARALPVELGRRYLMVDVTAQRLWAYELGRPVFSMKVVVGKPGEPTPQMAALVRYAVFRPYWNVPSDLVQASVAPKVLKQGLGYFHGKHLEALSSWNDNAVAVDPAKVNWRAVASGRQDLRVRQLPGPDNMMGRVKFMFPNQFGVYLHDSPLRAFFAGEQRLASAGCVRLEDAQHLAKWLLGDGVAAQAQQPGPPETRAELAEPVPVYIVYFTVAPTTQGLSVRNDIYRRDAKLIADLQRPPGTQLAKAGAAKAAPQKANARQLVAGGRAKTHQLKADTSGASEAPAVAAVAEPSVQVGADGGQSGDHSRDQADLMAARREPSPN
jgi:murein L,D-transpeptidase YcbB/YkuD